MHKTARYSAIMHALETSGSCSVADLTRRLGVSDETVRRDIKALAARGLVERVHGAVLLPERTAEAEFEKRMALNAAEKAAIARRAAEEIQDGDAVMIDNGATTAYVARALLARRDLFVITNGTDIARTLVRGKGNRVHLAGGEIRASDNAAFGETTIQFIRNFRARYAILSIGAVHPQGGFMDFHLQEAELARAMIEQSTHSMVVADHTKFRTQAPVKVCGLDGIGTLVCDQPPPEPLAEALTHYEARVLSVSEEGQPEPELAPL
ncbi:DeoR/GlpR family DNA-binding transcription regulator [Amorphus orientalis]|uniref:DeoR family glycerol-3-phosphate regulon repressor n=1 Tax=Amorphus orientalis TaxID=649198 RepID=A0AAE3VKT6_9HYPH|nr:DeoR/GlpR family DNA-binding transcription regulator [Amorphus orientalis]MDQ0313773.1 DeoR family glycerol-3-phosphate regulon repressor [Amorphus orientalis]